MKDNMFKKLKRGGKKSEVEDNVVVNKVDKTKVVKDACRTGNILQLVSRITGHSLQWMASKETLDGLGSLDKEVKSSQWTVNLVSNSVKEGLIIQLHNDGFYLSIVEGETRLAQFDEPSAAGDETFLKVSTVEQFVRLEAADESGHHIGVLNNGDLKAAIATGTEMESHFAPKIVYSVPVENGNHVKNSTEVINGGDIELEPVEAEQENLNKSKDDIKEDGEDKPEKKQSTLKKLKVSFRKKTKPQEIQSKKDTSEPKEVKDDIESKDNVEDAPVENGTSENKTDEAPSTENATVEITTKSEETTVVTVTSETSEQKEVIGSISSSEAITVSS